MIASKFTKDCHTLFLAFSINKYGPSPIFAGVVRQVAIVFSKIQNRIIIGNMIEINTLEFSLIFNVICSL